VLQRIDEGTQGWKGIPDGTRSAAKALRQYIESNKRLRGVVVNVRHALDPVQVVIRTKIWKKLL
jgi:hypothetical protein